MHNLQLEIGSWHKSKLKVPKLDYVAILQNAKQLFLFSGLWQGFIDL